MISEKCGFCTHAVLRKDATDTIYFKCIKHDKIVGPGQQPCVDFKLRLAAYLTQAEYGTKNPEYDEVVATEENTILIPLKLWRTLNERKYSSRIIGEDVVA